jgi:hypothetical protein
MIIVSGLVTGVAVRIHNRATLHGIGVWFDDGHNVCTVLASLRDCLERGHLTA